MSYSGTLLSGSQLEAPPFSMRQALMEVEVNALMGVANEAL
jgi:hypothetical protein